MGINAAENVLTALRTFYKNSAHLYGSTIVSDDLIFAAIVVLELYKWHGVDERPPREGRYLVYGTTKFIPDHNDQPDAYWEIKIARWSNIHGWMNWWEGEKIKYWCELPDLPIEIMKGSELIEPRRTEKAGKGRPKSRR